MSETEYCDKVDPTPAQNHENGYDILSYEKDGTPVMIEVKTTSGDENTSFYMSERELRTAKESWAKGKKYKIYRVSNIQAENKNKIKLTVYEQLSKELFDMSEVVYKIRRKV